MTVKNIRLYPCALVLFLSLFGSDRVLGGDNPFLLRGPVFNLDEDLINSLLDNLADDVPSISHDSGLDQLRSYLLEAAHNFVPLTSSHFSSNPYHFATAGSLQLVFFNSHLHPQHPSLQRLRANGLMMRSNLMNAHLNGWYGDGQAISDAEREVVAVYGQPGSPLYVLGQSPGELTGVFALMRLSFAELIRFDETSLNFFDFVKAANSIDSSNSSSLKKKGSKLSHLRKMKGLARNLSNQWDEEREAIRRVLNSAIPNGYNAYLLYEYFSYVADSDFILENPEVRRELNDPAINENERRVLALFMKERLDALRRSASFFADLLSPFANDFLRHYLLKELEIDEDPGVENVQTTTTTTTALTTTTTTTTVTDEPDETNITDTIDPDASDVSKQKNNAEKNRKKRQKKKAARLRKKMLAQNDIGDRDRDDENDDHDNVVPQPELLEKAEIVVEQKQTRKDLKAQKQERRRQRIIQEIANSSPSSQETAPRRHVFRFYLNNETREAITRGLNDNSHWILKAIFKTPIPDREITADDVYNLTRNIRNQLENLGVGFAAQLENFLNSHVHVNHPEHYLPRNYVSILREYFILCGFFAKE